MTYFRFNLVLPEAQQGEKEEIMLFFLCQYKACSYAELWEGPLQMSRETGLASKSGGFRSDKTKASAGVSGL